MKFKRYAMIAIVGLMLFSAVLACDIGGPITETITEEELNEDMAGSGFVVDLQPGVVVMTGDISGSEVIMKLTFEEVDGELVVEVIEATMDGQPIPGEFTGSLNEEIAAGIQSELEADGTDITVLSVEITETEITITYEEN